ncbi:MAG: hypothetical protein ABI592_06885 [Acidobacteriota bacterium]
MEAKGLDFKFADEPESDMSLAPIKPWYAVGRAVFDGTGEAVAAVATVDEARRIAAALNAVVGMPTEALEAWTLGSIQDPMNDLLADLESVLAPAPEDERRQSERRQTDRRRAMTEVRVQNS